MTGGIFFLITTFWRVYGIASGTTEYRYGLQMIHHVALLSSYPVLIATITERVVYSNPKERQHLKVYTNSQLEKKWCEFNSLDLGDVPTLVNHLGKDQPFVLAYLMASGENILNQNERNLLLFMGVMIWYLIDDDVSEIPEISDELLNDYQQQNYKMLDYLADEPESDFVNTVQVIMSKYHQPDLLQYIMDKLTNDLKNKIELRYQNLGIIVIYLKTVIDCLDSVI